LGGLALRYKKTSAEISLANCLVTDSLLPGQAIYLPPLLTHTPVLCSAPNTWVIYIVQQGDTLYHLGQVYGIPYTEIKSANCLASSSIHIGQQLYVPPWATRTSSPTLILFSDTQIEVATGETSTPTDTATPTPTEMMSVP
jgi:LysM repeat protein